MHHQVHAPSCISSITLTQHNTTHSHNGIKIHSQFLSYSFSVPFLHFKIPLNHHHNTSHPIPSLNISCTHHCITDHPSYSPTNATIHTGSVSLSKWSMVEQIRIAHCTLHMTMIHFQRSVVYCIASWVICHTLLMPYRITSHRTPISHLIPYYTNVIYHHTHIPPYSYTIPISHFTFHIPISYTTLYTNIQYHIILISYPILYRSFYSTLLLYQYPISHIIIY